MQDIIVYIIVGCITIYFLYKLYRNFIIIKKGDTMCQHCTQKCELRLLMEKKQAECLKNGGCGKKVAAISCKLKIMLYLCIRIQELTLNASNF